MEFIVQKFESKYLEFNQLVFGETYFIFNKGSEELSSLSPHIYTNINNFCYLVNLKSGASLGPVSMVANYKFKQAKVISTAIFEIA